MTNIDLIVSYLEEIVHAKKVQDHIESPTFFPEPDPIPSPLEGVQFAILSDILYMEKDDITGHFPGVFRTEENYGGEGMGSDYYNIFSYQADEDSPKEYFRIQAYFDSWAGAEWQDTELERVVPEEVVVVKWNHVGEEG